MGYFKCTLELESKVFNYFWHAFERNLLFRFLNIIVLLTVVQNALSYYWHYRR